MKSIKQCFLKPQKNIFKLLHSNSNSYSDQEQLAFSVLQLGFTHKENSYFFDHCHPCKHSPTANIMTV